MTMNAPRTKNSHHLRALQSESLCTGTRRDQLITRRIADVAHRLHAKEVAGESAATPAIVLLEVVLFLIPILLAIGALSFAAYYLA